MRGGNDQIPARLADALQGQITTGSELVAIRRNSDGSYRLSFRSGSGTSTVTADRVVLALPFSILRDVDYAKAGFSQVKKTAIEELGMGTNSKLHVQFDRRHWNSLGSNGETYADTGYQNTWEVTRAQAGKAGILVDYTGGNIGASFGSGTPDGTRRPVPQTDRAGAAGHLRALERPGDRRLLDRLPVDQGLLLVLEGRPVHEVRRRRARSSRTAATSPASTPRSTSRATSTARSRSGERAAGEILAALK